MARFGENWLNAVSTSMQTGAFNRMTETTELEIGKLDYRACILGASAFLLLDDYSLLLMRKIDVFAVDSPRVLPPLDEGFRPAVLANRNFQREVDSIGCALVLGLERSGGDSRGSRPKFIPRVIRISRPTFQYVERIVKFLLWQRGGHTLYVGGSP